MTEKNKYKFDDYFRQLKNIVETLRGEDGCPWDREQTIKTLKNPFLGEAEEVVHGIESDDMVNLCEELGDVLGNIFLITQIAEEKGHFNIDMVVKGTVDKLTRRHPHVFGDKKAKNADEALKLFNEEKSKEKGR